MSFIPLFTWNKKNKKGEKEGITCKYRSELESDLVKLVFECKDCSQRGDLRDRVCMREALAALKSEFNVDILIFSDYVETKYFGVAVETLKRAAKVLKEIQRFSSRKPWVEYRFLGSSRIAVQKKICNQCKKNPVSIFGTMKREGEKSLENLFSIFNSHIALLSASHNRECCRKCVETTREDMRYIQNMLLKLRRYVLHQAFKILESEI